MRLFTIYHRLRWGTAALRLRFARGYNLVRLSVVTSLCLLSPLTDAAVTISLSEPDWQFLLVSQPVSPTSAQLEPGELSFARQIQPWLQARDYAAVAKAFAARPLDKDSAALLQLRGQVLLALKRYDEAKQALNKALEMLPDLALAHRSLSMLYMLQKDYIQARQHLTRSIELGVADAQLYGQLAYINLNSQQAASAVAGYQQALFLQPDNLQWQQGLLYAWLNSQQYAPAQRLAEDILEQGNHHNPAELWLLRSNIALQQQHPEQALASLEIAMILSPQSVSNQLLAAKLHASHGSISRAVELLSASLQQAASDSLPQVIETLDQIIPWLLSQQQYSQAAALLKASDKLSLPSGFAAKFSYFKGELALQQQQSEQATKYLLRAVELDPAFGQALLSLAAVYQQQNQYALANNYYVRATAIPEVKLQALLANAQLYIDQGQYLQALDLLQQVQKLDPGKRDIQHNIRELQKIVRQSQYAS